MNEAPQDRRELSWRAILSLPEAQRPPWSALAAISFLLVMLLCLTLAGPALASLLLAGQPLSPLLLMLSWALGFAMTSLFVLVRQRSSEASWRGLRLGAGSLPKALALLIGVAIALALDLLVGLGGGRFLPLPQIFGFAAHGVRGLVVAALLLVLLQPLAETLVFQALLLPSLRWSLGPWPGLLLTCMLAAALQLLVFSAAQGEPYSPFWHGVAFPFLAAGAFCVMRVSSGASGSVLIARMGAGLTFLLTAIALSG